MGKRARTRKSAWVLAVVLAAALTGCSSEDEAAPEDLVGTWVSDDVTMEVTDDTMTATISGVADEDVVVKSAYTATSTTVEIVDKSGPIACAPDQTGTYEWEIADDVLSLTAVSDPCGRKNLMDGSTFERSD